MYVEQAAYQLAPDQCDYLRLLARRLDLAPGPGGARITPLGDDFVGDITMALQMGSVERASAIALYPSSQIVSHADPPVMSEWNRGRLTRCHIPLVVNDGCWSFHAGTWQQLEVGKVYQMDPTQTHGAVNWGTEVRLHLIVDVA